MVTANVRREMGEHFRESTGARIRRLERFSDNIIKSITILENKVIKLENRLKEGGL